MSDLGLETIGEDLARRQAVAAKIADLVRDLPGFENFSVSEVLKLSPIAAVLLARLGGEKVIVKRHFGPNAAQVVQNAKAELDFLAQTMAVGPLQINRCLRALPEYGLIVLNHVKGRPIRDVIAEAGPAKRQKLLRQAGEWLALYTAPRRRASVFGPGFWVNQACDQDIGGLPGNVQTAVVALRQALARRAEAHAGHPIIHAATHGDFVPTNAIFAKGVMTGIDVQGESWQAISRDVARFLQTVRPPDRAQMIYGVALQDWQAFHQSGALPPAEIDTTLPFFIGAIMHDRLISKVDDDEYIGLLQPRIDNYVKMPIQAAGGLG